MPEVRGQGHPIYPQHWALGDARFREPGGCADACTPTLSPEGGGGRHFNTMCLPRPFLRKPGSSPPTKTRKPPQKQDGSGEVHPGERRRESSGRRPGRPGSSLRTRGSSQGEGRARAPAGPADTPVFHSEPPGESEDVSVTSQEKTRRAQGRRGDRPPGKPLCAGWAVPREPHACTRAGQLQLTVTRWKHGTPVWTAGSVWKGMPAAAFG